MAEDSDHKEAVKALYEKSSIEKVFPGKKNRTRHTNWKEDSMIEAIDMKRSIMKYANMVDDLRSGKMEVQEAFVAASAEMLIKIMDLAEHGLSEKVRLAAAQDILDRAGFGAVSKQAILSASLDPNTSKEELVSLIEGLMKKTKI